MNDLRSLRNEEKAYLRFVNWTTRTVDVIWINFTGGFVKYQQLMRGQYVDIDTFRHHVWIAIDHHTMDRLHIEKQFVFYPLTTQEYMRRRCPHRNIPENMEARLRAAITEPVYSLRYKSLLTMRNFMSNPEDVDVLELPKVLAEDLKKLIVHRNNRTMCPTIGS